jgi:hypothetical protein
MPTLLRKDGFRFYFFSNENDEPVHIHVEKGDADGKIWLVPKIEIDYMEGFTNAELRQVAKIVFEYSEQFKAKWDGHFEEKF